MVLWNDQELVLRMRAEKNKLDFGLKYFNWSF